MSIFGKDVDEAADKLNKATIKAAEFEKKGLILQFKSVERVKSQYGAEEDATIVERGILEEGEQFVFKFVDEEGVERKHYSKSMPFFIGMHQVEMNENDWIQIRREGVKDKTRYYVELVEAPNISPRKLPDAVEKFESDQVNPDDIPWD